MSRKSPKNSPVIVHRISSGTFKTFEHENFKQAVMYTAMSLVDNGYATKREAQEWQATIKDFGMARYGEMMFEFVPYATREDDSTLGYLFAQMQMGKDHK